MEQGRPTGESRAERWRFLFRQDGGVIDAANWRLPAGALGIVFMLAAVAEWLANRSGKAIGIGVTAIFILSAMLIAASFYFLSAKRFRDRARPTALALVLPLTLLIVSALHFLQPPGGGFYPRWFATVGDVVLAGVIMWNIVELGFMGSRDVEPPP